MSYQSAGGGAGSSGWVPDDGFVVDSTRTGILVFDAEDLHVLHANKWARATFDLTGETDGRHLADLLVGVSDRHAHALLHRLRQGLIDHVVVEASHRTKDGSVKPVELRFTYSQDPNPTYLAIALDTSERSMPDELAIRRERLRDALAEILSVLNRIDHRDQLYREACRIAVERGGFRMAWVGLVDNESGDVVPVASAGDSIGYVDKLHLNVRDPRGPGLTVTAIQTEQPVSIADPRVDPIFTALRNQVLERGFQSAVSLPLVVEGQSIGALTVYGSVANVFGVIEVELLQHLADDISFKLEIIGREERRRAAEADRHRLAAVVEQAGESVVITDGDGRIVYTNPSFNRLLGYTNEEVLGKPLDFLRANSEAMDERDLIHAAIRGGGSWTGPHRGNRKDGQHLDLHLSISPMADESGAVVGSIMVGMDVSREKSLEAQLMQAQKMEAIGQLAGGVAHDFNNLLTAISGYADILQTELGPEDERTQDVAQIQRAATCATELTRQLLAFARRQVLSLRPLDPRSVVLDVAPMLRRLIGEDVELVVDVACDLGPIMADANQLEQVLVNLAVNARDAMSGGGRLTIDAREAKLDAAFVSEHLGARPGPYVVLTVGDTGVGMSEDVRKRAFEPFFTTKGPGQGTGLGLATVLGIVAQSNGYVDLESAPGKGSRFHIYIPKVTAAVDQRPDRGSEMHLGHQTGTLLVVEDEAQVRSLACRILRAAGYTVLEARSGEEAIALEANYRGPIHLLFTDVVLTGINGLQVADVLRGRRRDLPVLYASGYDREMIAARGVLQSGIGYVSKPYRADELLIRVQELVGKMAGVTDTSTAQ